MTTPGEEEDIWRDLSAALSDLDLDAILSDPSNMEAPGDAVLDTSHLVELGRDLSVQYVDVIANYATEVFASLDPSASRSQVQAAVANLHDLSRATNDQLMQDKLARLAEVIDEPVPRAQVQRTRYVDTLKAAIGGFGELLEGEGRQRLLGIVRYRTQGDPVLMFLRTIHGIGPRRLERLYLAGLHDLDRLTSADPEEVAAVTGLPLKLAHTVVEESTRFAEEERKRALHALSEKAAWLTRSVANLDPADDEQRSLIDGARAAMRHLESMLAKLEEQ